MAIARFNTSPPANLKSLYRSTFSKSRQNQWKKALRKTKKRIQSLIKAHSENRNHRKDLKCIQILIALNITIYILSKGIPSFFQKNNGFLLSPNNSLYKRFMKSNLAIKNGQFYRVLTGLFLHDNISHLLFNLYSLHEVGEVFESIHGSKKTCLVYLLSGAGANFMTYLFRLSPLSIGASSAIFGLYGSLLMAHKRDVDWEHVQRNLLLNLMYGVLSERVDNAAHIFGFLIGAAIPYLLPL